MFNLIRRISYGVIPRPDRPWDDDATSNAPARRRKRRLSSTERDHPHESEEELARRKKVRGDTETPENEGQDSRETPLPRPEAETSEVKEVTQGVKEVALDADSKSNETEEQAEEGSSNEVNVNPEHVPLPDEDNGELDELQERSASEPKETEDGDGEDAAVDVAKPAESSLSDSKVDVENKEIPVVQETTPALDDSDIQTTSQSPKKQAAATAK